MFLRAIQRKKNGKVHRYFSIAENRRVSGGKVVQRQVLHLGEINDSQQVAWRKTLSVFDERQEESAEVSLFPEDRPLPPNALNAVQVKLSEMQLKRPRCFGNCWLGCEIWRQLGLDTFWSERLQEERGEVPWQKVLQLLVVNRLIDPGSEFRVHRQWFERSAMDQLLEVDFACAAKDRLYRCLDRVLEHKDALFKHLRTRWTDLFSSSFEVLLYDLTSTYFEGLCERIPKAKHGYSRDGRPDCRQVVIALIITPDDLPLAYEVMPGNTSDKTTLKDFLKKIEERYGKAQRTWLMDRGIPTEEVLAQMRKDETNYLVGTPKGKLTALEQEFLALPWKDVREDVAVKMLEQTGETLVLAKSEGRRKKEQAIRRKKLQKLFDGLRALQKQKLKRDALLGKLGVLKHDAGRAAGLVEIKVPGAHESVTRETFRFSLRVEKFKQAQQRDGHYLLRTNLRDADPALLWSRYMQLTQIEAAFKTLKSDLALRPIFHHKEARVEAHIFVAFLAYCLVTTLRKRLEVHAPGLTPKAVLEKLATIQMIDVWLPTSDNLWLIMPRYTQPEPEQQIMLDLLKMKLPAQPPPRIRAAEMTTETPQKQAIL